MIDPAHHGPDAAMRRVPQPSKSEPAVRLARLKEDLPALAALGPEVQARILARMSPRTLAAIEEGTRVSWVPIALKAELAEAVFAEAGAAGARAWGRASFFASLDSFFKPLITGVVSLFGLSPATLLRIAPQSWQAVYRNAGELAVRRDGEFQARILARGLPEGLRGDAYLNLLAGTFDASREMTKHDGEITFQRGGERPGDVTYFVTWKPRRD